MAPRNRRATKSFPRGFDEGRKGKPNLELIRYVQRLVVSRYGTHSALAAAIGMSLSAFSRAVREEGTLSVENCEKLAVEVGDNPAHILRLARRPEHAEVAENLYGRSDETLTRREMEHMALWRRNDSIAHDAVDALLQMRLKVRVKGVKPATPSGFVPEKRHKVKGKRKPHQAVAAAPPAGSDADAPS